MEVEKISEMCIKPSSSTPPHLKTYKISLLDQLTARAKNIPVVLYYPKKYTNLSSKMSMSLKRSLSQALTHYYPLAGRIKDDFSVDCNDEGVCYVDAKANISLSEYLTQPDFRSMNSLLPINDWYVPDSTRPNVLMIQETIFSCGSITIGVLGSHMVMDGIAFVSFLKCWAAIARGSTKKVVPPNFDGPSIFPQNKAFPEDTMLTLCKPLLRSGKYFMRRFVLDASSIANLKMTSNVKNPTRVEVVSALLLECIAAVFKERSSGTDRPLAFTHNVNIRRRTTPQLPESSLGNILCIASALCTPEEIKVSDLIYKQREAIKEIDSVFVKNMQSGGFHKQCEMLKEKFGFSQSGVNYVGISSWCNFGIYEIDFGWGKPIWTTSTPTQLPDSATPFMNIILLEDTGTDKGIEALVFMDEEELLLLEKHKHLLQYASVNPSPLKLAH